MADDTFEADWLDLRSQADERARARSLVTALRREGRRRGWSRLVDLGAGTGANMRYLTARLPWAREWTLVDHDPALLERVEPPAAAASVRTITADLAVEGLDVVDGAHVVTASAFLDLVGEEWLRALRDRCVSQGSAAYFALTYDGTVRWEPFFASRRATNRPGPTVSGGGTPAESGRAATDALVLEAVNEHQRSEKGLGRALGPEAAGVAESLFAEAGYRVRSASSPWVLTGARNGGLIEALIEGWAEAAAEARPDERPRIRAWAGGRWEEVRRGEVGVRVGHVDLLALPSAGEGAR